MAMITFSWKSAAVGNLTEKVGIKENFAKGLRVCSWWWRCQFLVISIAFGEDRCLRFFSEERAWRKERKRGYTFASFLLNATPRHERLARKKNSRTEQRFGIFFKRNFRRLFKFFFSGYCLLRDNAYLRR